MEPAVAVAAALEEAGGHSRQPTATTSAPGSTASGQSSQTGEVEAQPVAPRKPGRPRSVKRCQVCQVELAAAGLKGYYLRYRICPDHRDALAVLLNGVQQRFCQQCGTFHPVAKFSGSRRSCKDRLRKHAIRRRKYAGTGRPSTWQWDDSGSEGEHPEDFEYQVPVSKRKRAALEAAAAGGADGEEEEEQDDNARGGSPEAQPSQRLPAYMQQGGSPPIVHSPQAVRARRPFAGASSGSRPGLAAAGSGSADGLEALLVAAEQQDAAEEVAAAQCQAAAAFTDLQERSDSVDAPPPRRPSPTRAAPPAQQPLPAAFEPLQLLPATDPAQLLQLLHALSAATGGGAVGQPQPDLSALVASAALALQAAPATAALPPLTLCPAQQQLEAEHQRAAAAGTFLGWSTLVPPLDWAAAQ